MARKMAVTVVLRDPATGQPAVLPAGSEAPAWAEKVITNDAVYEPVEKARPSRRKASDTE